MVCALLVKHGKNVNDIIQFYKKVTGHENIVYFIYKQIINWEYAEYQSLNNHRDLAILNLMLAAGIMPKYETEEIDI